VLEQYDNTTNSPYGYVDLVGGSSGSNIYFSLTPTFPNDYSIHTTGSIQDSYNTGVAPTAGDTYWMVFEITYGATNTVSLWVDPNPTLSSPSSSTSTSGSWIIAAPQITAVTIDGAGNSGDINEWDELRIGSTWASVAPTISGGGDDIISRGKVTGAAPLASSAATTPAGSAGTTVVSDPPIAPIAAAKPFAATSATISTSDGSSPVSDPPLTAVAVQNNSAGSPFLTASSPSNAGGDGDSGGNMVDSLMADNSDDLLLNQKSSQRSSVFR